MKSNNPTKPIGVGTAGGVRVLDVKPPPDPEVAPAKNRRRFTAKYKMRVLQEADRCKEPGQLGALLRGEGLYSSHLTTWRRQRKQGMLTALTPKKRGRKNDPKNPLAQEVARLEKENLQLQKKLHKAEIIIDVQKKFSRILQEDRIMKDEDIFS